ncbi:MAG: hypothetical protein ACI4IE_04250 [Eubacterium sp.]
MHIFDLTEEALKKGWSSSNEYWFSHKDYKLHNTCDLASLDIPDNMSQTSYFISLGYIPYFSVTNEEVIRAYSCTVNNKKLRDALSKLNEDVFVDSFWKYVKIYPELAQGLSEFEDSYVLEKAISWCKENDIEYRVIND